jgi:hypothetical protein
MVNHQQPQTYLPHLPTTLVKNDPLYRLSQPLDGDDAGDSDSVDYQSRGVLKFKVIAKNRKWNQDFWNDLVGPTLGDDMDVETWIRGPIPPTQDSDGIHKTFDIKFIDLRSFGTDWSWPESKDHAKWSWQRRQRRPPRKRPRPSEKHSCGALGTLRRPWSFRHASRGDRLRQGARYSGLPGPGVQHFTHAAR